MTDTKTERPRGFTLPRVSLHAYLSQLGSSKNWGPQERTLLVLSKFCAACFLFVNLTYKLLGWRWDPPRSARDKAKVDVYYFSNVYSDLLTYSFCFSLMPSVGIIEYFLALATRTKAQFFFPMEREGSLWWDLLFSHILCVPRLSSSGLAAAGIMKPPKCSQHVSQ